jgi:hypothetical protein
MRSGERTLQDLFLRELMSSGRIVHKTTTHVKGIGPVTKTITKTGPVSFWVTTTKNQLHEENETRMLSLQVDDSPDQTRRVMLKTAAMQGCNDAPPGLFDRWHEFQRYLFVNPTEVYVPYADALARLIPPKAVRLRRDFPQLLMAIKTHALLHREWRDGPPVHANIHNDYAHVAELMTAPLASVGTSISKSMRDTLMAVQSLQPTTAQDVGRALGLNKSSALRRLQSAEEAGLVVNLEPRRFSPGLYRIADAAKQGLDVLPSPQELEAEFRDNLQPGPI